MSLVLAAAAAAAGLALDPAALPLAGTVAPRFHSYNIEMVEVTGGRFWRPYRYGPVRSPEERYSYRPPIDLSNRRLRLLARALGPAYVRVSGTWANTTWYAGDSKAPRPAGFEQTLTRAQLRGLADFLRHTGSPLVTSFAVSGGTRNAAGEWQPDQMQAFVRDARSLGITIAAAEFANEPNLVAGMGVPPSYSAADWGRDYRRFAAAFRAAAPGALIQGPGSIGDGTLVERAAAAAGLRLLPTRELLPAQGQAPDIFSYHYYGGVSERCATSGPLSVSEDQALDPTWLARTDTALAMYRGLRDQHAPGKPIWLTETGQAACGGSRWAATFRDTPRYVDQLGRLARQGVQVVMHNTFAVSDYALLDPESFAPRPSYWAALLWSRLMGERVLAVDSPDPKLRVYAHCLKGRPGGVALVAINLSGVPADLRLGHPFQQYALTGSADLVQARLNGRALSLGRSDRMPRLDGEAGSGSLQVPAEALSFAALPEANNQACR